MSRLALFFLLPAAVLAQDSFEFTGRYWIPDLASTVRVESNGLGTDIDARRDLGIPNTNFPGGTFLWKHERHRLKVDYTPISYSGDQAVTRTLLYGGKEYTVGTRVVSDLEIHHIQLGWAYMFDIHNGYAQIGPVIEGNGFLMRGRLRAPALTVDSTENLRVGVPTAGLAFSLHPHRMVEVYGQVAGMSVGKYGSFVNSDSGVKVNPWNRVLLTAGYRTFNLNADVTNDFAHFRLRGFFVGAGFRLSR